MMKRLLMMSLLFGSINLNAQEAEQGVLRMQKNESDYFRTQNTALKSLNLKSKKTRAGSRWYDIVDAVDESQGASGNIYNNDSYNLLWQDSTLLAPYSGSSGVTYSGIWVKSIAAFFDPADPRFNDASSYGGELAINRNNAYTLDSLFLPFIYNRNASKPGIVDTLIVSIVKGTGTSSTTDLATRYYGPTTVTAVNHLVDTLRYLHGFLNLNPASVNPFTFNASASTNVMNVKIPLTAAKETDTLSNGFNYFQIPVNMQIPANNFAGVCVTFKSGDTWVPYADTAYISGNPDPKFNYFRFVAFEETAGGYATYLKGYWNQSSLVENDTVGWGVKQIPSYAYTNTKYEYHWFRWKASCATCGSVNVNDLNALLPSIKIFPNPVQAQLNYRIFSHELLKRAKLQIVSIDGKIMFESVLKDIQSNKPFDSQIQLKNLSIGLYLLKLETDKGTVIEKIVKE